TMRGARRRDERDNAAGYPSSPFFQLLPTGVQLWPEWESTSARAMAPWTATVGGAIVGTHRAHLGHTTRGGTADGSPKSSGHDRAGHAASYKSSCHVGCCRAYGGRLCLRCQSGGAALRLEAVRGRDRGRMRQLVGRELPGLQDVSARRVQV